MIKMVVLDMAGTVIDEGNVVYKTLLKAINEEGFGISLEQVLAEGAGKEKFQAIKDILTKHADDHTPSVADKIYPRFKTYLQSVYNDLEIKSQPGAEVLFHELIKKNIYVVLNTGYDLHTAQTILRKVGWQEGKQIDAVVTASHVTKNRPEPDMIEFAKRKFGLNDSNQVIKVGDSIIDIEEGQNAKCRLSIGITTGAQSREQLLTAKPDFVIDGLMEILPLIEDKIFN